MAYRAGGQIYEDAFKMTGLQPLMEVIAMMDMDMEDWMMVEDSKVSVNNMTAEHLKSEIAQL